MPGLGLEHSSDDSLRALQFILEAWEEGADQGIAQDYAGYRAQNRAKLVEYLGEFVAPKPAGAQSTPAAN